MLGREVMEGQVVNKVYRRRQDARCIPPSQPKRLFNETKTYRRDHLRARHVVLAIPPIHTYAPAGAPLICISVLAR